MLFQSLLLRCECGKRTSRIREVGLTTDHQLVLHWRCPSCKRYVYVVKSLSECWRECPAAGYLGESPEVQAEVFGETDEVFLQSIGIKCTGDGDGPFAWDPPWRVKEEFADLLEWLSLRRSDAGGVS